jgi:hypothetical protein
MMDVINTRSPVSTRKIDYEHSLHARERILDLEDFHAYSGEFDASTGVLTVFTIDGEKALVFQRQSTEGNDALRLSTGNILVYLKFFPNLTTALGATFNANGPGGEPSLPSFSLARSDGGTTIVVLR